MGEELNKSMPRCKELLEAANDILGYDLGKVMFNGTDEDLANTKYAQPAIYTVSSMYIEKAKEENIDYGCVA